MIEFNRYGVWHWGALGFIALGLLSAHKLSNHLKGDPKKLRKLQVFSLFSGASYLVHHLQRAMIDNPLSAATLPLQLCDMVHLVSICAILTGRRTLISLTFFWGATFVTYAMITPNLHNQISFIEFFFFYLNHGFVVFSIPLLFGVMGFVPSIKDLLRVQFISIMWIAAVYLFNLLLGTNYMFLMKLPSANSPLNILGPWPVYILSGFLVVSLIWSSMVLPWLLHPTQKKS